MADVLTKEQRHKNMQHIKSKDTRPEVVLRKALWRKGFRYRKNYKGLPGKPDIVFVKQRTCIFVDGEFFHGKGFDTGYESKKYDSLRHQLEHSNNSKFWLSKIQGNIERDHKVNTELEKLGWKVIRIWSKDALKKTDECVQLIEKIIMRIENQT